MAAKKAPKKPKFTPRPYKPRKPKPKPRRTDDEILADARKELKRITDGPKFSHRPYKPRKPKPKVNRSHSEILADARKELSGLTKHRRSQRSYTPKLKTPTSRQPTNSYTSRDSAELERILHNNFSLGKNLFKVVSFESPFIPIAFSSKKSGQADAGIVFSSEIFYFVCEKNPLCFLQAAAVMTGNSYEQLLIENLYSVAVFYRKCREPWGSYKPVHVFSLEYHNTQDAMKPQGLWSKLVGKPLEPDMLGLIHYSATGRKFLRTYENEFNDVTAYRLLIDLALDKLGMDRGALFTVGSVRDVRADSPSLS
jgi:hypothetical protein